MKLEHFFTYFKPENYNLTLKINRPERTFDGVVSITGKVQNPERIVKLHANYLTIESVRVGDEAIEFQYQDNVLSFIKASDEPIEIRYHGQISDQMNGIYPCYYQIDGQPHELIATQFESHYAREVFPCVDEPIAKATFNLTLITEADITVLSNAELQNQEILADASMKTTFATTPKMSNYTLGFVLGKLIEKTGVTNSGVKVRVFATPAHQEKSLDFALDVAIRSIEFYEKFLGVKYPLTKCDHVALSDFAAGAMENWGLVTYREALLLADETTSVGSKKQIASVIAHELAHMWFGNLVTMKWWDELWLNESLATLLEHFAVDAIYPEYKIWHDFYSFNYQYAQSRDALAGVQPILTPIEHPDEISTIFDGAIVYAKGACVMLMLEKWLGQETFRQALAEFLTEFAHQNPTTEDFLAKFDQISGKNVTEFMQKWLTQSGFPLVKFDGRKLTQGQFGYQTTQTWQIPLHFRALKGDDISAPELLTEAQADFKKDGVLLNHDIASFAVTDYDAAHKAEIRQALSDGRLSLLDEFYFLSNQILLAKHNYISSAELVDDLQAFSGQKLELLLWSNLAKIIASLRFFVEATEAETNLKQLVTKLPQKQAEQLGFVARATDSPDDLELRALLTAQLSYAEYQPTIDYLIQQFDAKYPENLTELDPDLRSVVISAKLKFDFQESVFEELIQQYRSTNNPDFKDDLRTALTSVRNLDAGRRLIELLDDKSIIKNQDLSAWFVMILRNRQLKDLAWQWLKTNFTKLRQTFSENKDYADFARYAGAVLYTDQDLREFDELFKQYASDLAMTRTIEVGRNEIALRNQLFKRDAQAVADKLTQS